VASFVELALSHSPSFLLDFRSGLGRMGLDLSGNGVGGQIVGGGTPSALPTTIVPSDGDYGSGTLFGSNAGGNFGSSCAWMVPVNTTATGGPLRPTGALTMLLCCDKPTYSRQAGLFSCTQSGGWNIELTAGSPVKLSAFVRQNGAYSTVSVDASVLQATNNLIIATCDGRYTKLHVNGVTVGVYDAGAIYPIQYAATTVHIVIGAESTGTSAQDFPELPVQYAGLYTTGLSDSDCADLYTAFSAQKRLAGTVVHSDGSAGKAARIRPWYDHAATLDACGGHVTRDVTPNNITGEWEMVVPDGQYEVVLVGDSGYQPVTHGPVSPVPV